MESTTQASGAAGYRAALLEKARVLRDKRADLAKVREEWAKRQEVFRAQNKLLTDNLTYLAAEAEAIERDVRSTAVMAFQASGGQDKHPAPGIAIRVGSKLVYDPRDALAWAVQHGLAIILDVKTFEAIADAALSTASGDSVELSRFVKREQDVKATVTPKLHEILTEMGYQ